MNKTQSKKLAGVVGDLQGEVHAKLEELKDIPSVLVSLGEKVHDALDVVKEVRDDIGEKFDNLSEKAQEGKKAQEMQTERDSLDETVTLLEELETEFADEDLKDLGVSELGEKVEELQGKLDEIVSKLAEH